MEDKEDGKTIYFSTDVAVDFRLIEHVEGDQVSVIILHVHQGIFLHTLLLQIFENPSELLVDPVHCGKIGIRGERLGRLHTAGRKTPGI